MAKPKIKLPKKKAAAKKPVYNQLAARQALAKKVGGTYNPATGKVDRAPVKQELPQSATYQANMAGLAGDADAIKRKYGFDAGYEADPFSQANLLKKHYEQARSGTGVSQAAKGNLYSSALRNALTQDRTSYEQNVHSARQDQEDALRGIDQQKAGLEAERLDEALANPPAAAPKKPAFPKITKSLLKKAGVGKPSKKVIAKAKAKAKKKGKR